VVEYEKPRPQIPIGWAEARRQVTRTQTHRPQIGEARTTQVVAGLHCPSWARSRRTSPKKTAGALAPAIAPPGLEPGLS